MTYCHVDNLQDRFTKAKGRRKEITLDAIDILAFLSACSEAPQFFKNLHENVGHEMKFG